MAGPRLRSAALCLLGLLLLWQPRFVTNDDVAQAAGLWSLADGHLSVDTGHLPASFEPFLDGRYRHFSFGPENSTVAPFGSTPLNLAALPALWLLRAMAVAVGEVGAVTLAAAALAGLATHVALRAARPGPTKGWAFAAAFAVGIGMARSDVPVFPYLEVAALQLVGIAATAGVAWLVHDLVRQHTDERTARWTAVLVGLGTPLAFWAVAAKYHAVATLLAMLALWLYRDGPTTSPRRTAVAFLVAGLACWNSLPFGIITGLSLLVLSLGVLRLPGRERWMRVGAIVGVGLLALVPELVQRALSTASGQDAQYVPKLWGGNLSYLFDPNSTTGWLAHTIFTEPLAALSALARALAWPDPLHTGPALPLLATAPILLLAVAGWRSSPANLRRIAATFILVQIALFGSMLDTRTQSFDLRYMATWWPLAALLAAPALHRFLQRDPARGIDVAADALAMLWAMLAAVFIVHSTLGLVVDYGPSFELVWPWRIAGLVAAAGVLGAVLVGARRPGPADAVVRLALPFSFALQAYLALATAPLTYDLEPPWAFWPLDAISRGVDWVVTTLA